MTSSNDSRWGMLVSAAALPSYSWKSRPFLVQSLPGRVDFSEFARASSLKFWNCKFTVIDYRFTIQIEAAIQHTVPKMCL